MAALNRRLLVTDGSGGAFSVSEASNDQWDVLPIGIDAGILEHEQGGRLSRLDACRILDAVAWADQAARDVREFVIPFLHGLPERPGPGGRRLGDLLRAAHGNDWWFLEISEKSPMRGTLVQELYALALVRRAACAESYQAIVVECANPRLASALRSAASMPPITDRRNRRPGPAVHSDEWMYWVQAILQLLRLCLVRAVGILWWPDTSVPPPSPVLFFTIYPHWWLGAGTPDGSERFFPDLPDQHEGIPLRYVAWIASKPRRLWAERRRWAGLMGRTIAVPLQRFVPFRAAVALLSPLRFRRLRAFRRAVARTELPRFLDFDVTPLITAEISRSIGSSELPLDQLLYAGVRRLASVARPRAVVYRTEWQPIERALVQGGHGRTRMVGFWHSPMAACENYLSYHFPDGSLCPGADADAVAPTPLPDAMLVSGAICERTLTRQGYPASHAVRCSPIRHREALALVRRRPDRGALRAAHGLPPDATVLFVAASVVTTDSRAMLWTLASAVRTLGECIIMVRMHPAAPRLSAELRALTLAVGASAVREVTSYESMFELLASSDAVITGGTSLAFEAIALGVFPILFETPSSFSASSFVPFEHACFVTRNAAQLSAAIHSVIRQDDAVTEKRRNWPTLVREVFGDVTVEPGAPFLDAIGRAVGVSPC